MFDAWPWPSGYAAPVGRGRFKSEPDDFQVVEQLSQPPCGQGEHLYLQIEKRDQNTEWVAKALAEQAGIALHDVGYAGKKDRYALTRQWFSLYLPQRQWSAAEFKLEGTQVLEQAWHTHKLRRGELAANAFVIRLRQWQGERAACEARLAEIQQQGVANYFGPQRFGHQFNNLSEVEGWLAQCQLSRAQQVQLISVGRSYVFNHLLARRISDGLWRQLMPGDVLWHRQRGGSLLMRSASAAMQGAFAKGTLQITGPLWGQRNRQTCAEALAWEDEVLADLQPWLTAIARWQSEHALRSLQLCPEQLQWQWSADELLLKFTLPAGSYATSVLLALMPADVLVKDS